MLLPKECTMKASSNQGAWVTRGPGSPRMSREETNTEKKKKWHKMTWDSRDGICKSLSTFQFSLL